MIEIQDTEQLGKKGITPEKLERQLRHFRDGFPYIQLAKPAVPGDGILVPDDAVKSFYIRYFDENFSRFRMVKFVPASGAASRMFKHLFEFREKYRNDAQGLLEFTKDQTFNSVHYLITHIQEIAFFAELNEIMKNRSHDLERTIEERDFGTLIQYILTDAGLDYANLPKGLIKFHDYPEGARTSAEEHLVEAGLYARDGKKQARLHFTISPEHQSRFTELVNRVKPFYEEKLDVTLDVSYSVQKPSTDTVAVNERNEPFRNPDGTLLFRPGGHGALLENLNEIDADIVFVKNIDNIVPDRLKGPTVDNKKLIGGYLLFARHEIDAFLAKADRGAATPGEIDEMAHFATEKLQIALPADFRERPAEEQCHILFSRLNRPMRVCGMVKNEGEPGGGPFWVKNHNGEISLQIVESSQINLKDESQQSIMAASTHFNPVDLVCSMKNYRGEKFDLSKFVDEEAGFISLKSTGGKTLKAQELPGLWNGAMADWITVFIEVPIITFNPVKTVNDLLRKEHLRQ